MTDDTIGIGASTEARVPTSPIGPPHWVQVTLVDRVLHVACLRCVTHEPVKPDGQALQLVRNIDHFIRMHSLCSSFREAL